MATPVPTQAWFAIFSAEIDSALEGVQENFHINDWPAAAPRFESTTTDINYHPSQQLFELSATADIFSPERKEKNYSRAHWQTVMERVFLPFLPEDVEDEEVLTPYMAALANVLAERVTRVLRADIKKRKKEKV